LLIVSLLTNVCNRIEDAAAHFAASAEAMCLQREGIIVVQIVQGDGEANDCCALDLDDAATEAFLLVARKFKRRGGDAEFIELTLNSIEERFGFGGISDGDEARVKRSGGRERAGGGDAER
jgi:hypothetical protein